MTKTLVTLVIGAAVGIAVAVPAIHSSRNAASPLGKVRAAVGLSPPLAVEPAVQRDVESEDLLKRFGPNRSSQFLEEWIIRDFFQDRRGGVFVDIGAANYKDASNTYFLEHDLGWSGIAVDAQDQYRSDWQKYRTNAKFFTAFVSDRSNDKARLFLSNASSWVASSQQKFTEGWGKIAGSIEVPTITLNDLLGAAKIQKFDFLSLDIELAEPGALAGLDLERFKPSLACVEAHPQVRQQIIDYFTARHYRVVGKYLRVDGLNLWFMPEGASVAPFAPQTSSKE